MNATTQLETVNVKAEKRHGLGNQQPSAVAYKHGEGSTIIPMGVDPEQGRSARCLTSRTCRKCETELPMESFYFNRQRNHFDSMCKECRKANSVAWKQANPQRAKEIVTLAVRKHAAAHRQERRQSSREWYARNQDAQRARVAVNHVRFAERRLEYRKWYEATFPEKTRERTNRRRAIKLLAIPSWADFDAIKALYVAAKAAKLDVDHIVPLKSKYVCGLHCEANLQLLPSSENASKGNRWWPDMPT